MLGSHQSNVDKDTFWIVEHKFEPVRPGKELVSRARLLRSMAEAVNYKLTLIAAPAGYGKSSLLAQWAATQSSAEQTMIWLTLEKSDADPKQFMVYLVFALHRNGIDTQDLLAAAKNGFADSDLHNIVTLVLRAIRQLAQRAVLILEDYHWAECAAVNQITSRLIKESGAQFSLIIDSRVRPQLEIFSLIALGEAQEIGPGELRLTEYETYVALSDIEDETARRDIFVQTEGWPVAVQLARIKKKKFPQQPILAGVDGGVVACYLAEQVLSFLDQDTKQFLLAVSFLDRFNAALTNHVLDNPTGWQQIEKLSAFSTLFVPLDQQGGWYRLHHLFAEYLRDLQNKQAQSVANMYLLRASQWHAGQRQLVMAVQYAARAQDYYRCEQIIKDAGGWRIILYEGIEVLRAMLRPVPAEHLAQSPRLLIAQAYLHCKDGTISQARGLIEEARQHITLQADSRLEISLMVNELLIYTYEDQPHPSPQLRHTLAKYRHHEALLPIEQGIIHCFDVINSLAAGELAQTAAQLDKAFLFMRQSGSVLGLNYCYIHAALLALISADLTLARDNIERALTMAEENFGMDSGLKTLAKLLAYVLHVWQGQARPDDLPLLRQTLNATLAGDGWVDIYIAGTEAAVMLAYQSGQASQAQDILQDVMQHANVRDLQRLRVFSQSMSQALKGEAIASIQQMQARDWHRALAIVCAQPGQHPALLNQLSDFVQHRQLKLHQTALSLASNQNNQQQLLSTLALAAERGIWGALLASDQAMQHLQRLAQSNELPPEHGAALNNLARLHTQLTPTDDAMLSEREQQVIEQLASGHSNKQIARTLALTENTVKFHLKNVFSKLGVNKRTQAIVQAQQLGIIE